MQSHQFFECVRTIENEDSTKSLAITPDGEKIISYHPNQGCIRVQELNSGKIIHNIKCWTNDNYRFFIDSLSLSPNGQEIRAACCLAPLEPTDCIIKWDLNTGKRMGKLLVPYKGSSSSVAISSDAGILATGGYLKNVISVWDRKAGKLLYKLDRHTDGIKSIVISSDDKTIVSGSSDGTVKAWDLRTGNLLHSFTGESVVVTAVAFSANHQTIVSGGFIFGKDSKPISHIEVWNLCEKKLIHIMRGHASDIESVAISSNGQLIVSGSMDKTIKVWKIQ